MNLIASHQRAAAARAPTPARLLPAWHDVAIAALLLGVTVFGILAADAYRVSPGVRANFPDVMRGQDVVTMLSVPPLLWAGHRARQGSLAAHFLRLGLLLYYGYTYVVYAFSPYNDVYLGYVAIVGLSLFGLLDGLFRVDARAMEASVDPGHSRGTGVFLVAVGSLLVGLAMLAMNLLFNNDPNLPKTLLWGTIAVTAATLMTRLLHHVSTPTGAWMRESVWR